MNTQDYIREFVSILFIQKRIILGIMVAISIIVIVIALLWPPRYAAVCSVLLKAKKITKSPEAIENVRLSVPRVSETDVFSEMRIVTSNALIRETILALKAKGLIFPKGKIPDDDMRGYIAKIQGNLSTEIVPRSNVFNVKLKWHDPREAEIILQTLMDRYVAYRKEIYSPKEAESFFKEQVDNFDNSLRKIEENLMNLIRSSGSARPEKEIDNNLLIQKNLQQELNLLLNRYIERKRYLQYLEKVLNSGQMGLFCFVDNVNIANLGQKLQSLIVKKADLLRLYTPQSNAVKRAQEEIDIVSKSLKEEVKRYVNGERAKLQGVEKAIDSLKERLKKVTEENVELYRNSIEKKRLKRKMAILENSYSTFAKRWEEAKIDQNVGASRWFSVSILGDAHASMTPVFPNKKTFIPIGILIASLTGVVVGFTREFFDHTFKRPEEVENYLNLPTLFSIPQF